MSDRNSDNEMNSAESDDNSENSETEEPMDDEQTSNITDKAVPAKEVYLPGKQLEKGEQLVCDETAYIMLHQAQTGAPCLSFDIIPDNLGNARDTYPLTAYCVAGTQAAQYSADNIIVMKLSNLHRTGADANDDDDDDEELDDEDDHVNNDKNPQMAGALIKHQGCVNRIRCTTLGGKIIAASWSELGRVNIWDLTQQLKAVDNSQVLDAYNKANRSNSATPLYTFTGHQKEGFAIDWCPTVPGVLATGDCKQDIHIWQPSESGKWHVDQRPLIGHTASVEDIQWSPNERNVFASCSIDQSIRVWDTRAQPKHACMLTADKAHTSDVNVISWNRNEPFIVSGGDDGFLHVWDLRRFTDKTPVATFKHHTEPVTTVEWHPNDSAVFSSGGSDNQIALWDLSVENDADEATSSEEISGIPPQLLFIHQGQTNIKELHWHRQIPGVIISTAENGFNIFRTISV